MLDALLLTLAAGLILLTMAVHSLLGQKRLIQPLLSIEDDILTHPLARFLIGFAWHLTSAIGAVLAAILLAWAWVPDHARAIGLAATGVVFLAAESMMRSEAAAGTSAGRCSSRSALSRWPRCSRRS